ncbi:MAG TPA: hypothetical protein VFT75_16315, partial [Nocardioidaceae bacterium]|nr:hypothetical protein [Nocardioidaceae bacterium]
MTDTDREQNRGGAAPSAAQGRRGQNGQPPNGQSPADRLMRSVQYFFPGVQSDDRRSLYRKGGRQADEFYRERWRHDREVRSTHGVNCTG